MAISAPHYRLLLEHRDILPRGGSLLEIGEANWYGDVNPLDMLADADKTVHEFIRAAARSGDYFKMAKACYATVFRPSVVHAIDANGTKDAMRFDLNHTIKLPQQYDVIMNHGTAEHVFNIAQVFRTMHDACKVGGVMIHESPVTGWVDHGFYTLQPTLFYDLAATNGYGMVSVSITEIRGNTVIRLESRDDIAKLAGQIPDNSMLYVVYRKVADSPFAVPWQGYYDRTLSEAGEAAWREMR